MKRAQLVENTESPSIVNEVLEIIFRDRLRCAALHSAAMNHELLTPLIIIRGLTESLMRKPAAHSQAHLQEIADEAENLIKNLEAMSYAPPSEPIKNQSISLCDLVDRSIIFFEKSCLEKGISVRIDVDPNIRIVSEPVRLKHILIALLENAVESLENKSSRELKNITIHAQDGADRLHLIISDTGQGMTLEEQLRLTNEILTLKKWSELKLSLSLSLAQKLANELQIKLDFVSEKSRGSSFTLSFFK